MESSPKWNEVLGQYLLWQFPEQTTQYAYYDYKVTLNQNAEVPQHLLHNDAEEIFARLAGGKYFTKLDVLFCPLFLSLQLRSMVLGQLKELGELYKTSILTQEEFEEQKKILLEELRKV